MAQDITQFYSTAVQNDFARQFQFRIITLINTNFYQEKQLVYLESSNLPGRQINNIAVPFMGLQFNVPGTASYPGSDAWAVTFRCDANYNIREALENATIATFNDATSVGNYSIPGEETKVVIQLMGKDPMVAVRQYELYGAYVTSIGESTYNLGDNGSIVTIPATVAYQYWRSTPLPRTGGG